MVNDRSRGGWSTFGERIVGRPNAVMFRLPNRRRHVDAIRPPSGRSPEPRHRLPLVVAPAGRHIGSTLRAGGEPGCCSAPPRLGPWRRLGRPRSGAPGRLGATSWARSRGMARRGRRLARSEGRHGRCSPWLWETRLCRSAASGGWLWLGSGRTSRLGVVASVGMARSRLGLGCRRLGLGWARNRCRVRFCRRTACDPGATNHLRASAAGGGSAPGNCAATLGRFGTTGCCGGNLALTPSRCVALTGTSSLTRG